MPLQAALSAATTRTRSDQKSDTWSPPHVRP